MYKFFNTEIAGVSADNANLIAMAVIGLIALILLYMLYRLIRRPRLASGRRSKHARLAITDAALIDERRKLVLVRRDDVEHLVLIGGASDLVIESNIRRNAPARPISAQPVSGRATIQPQAQPQQKPPAPTPPIAPVVAASPPPIPPVAPTVASVSPPTPSIVPAVASVGAGIAAVAVGGAALASNAKDKTLEVATKAADEVKAQPETTEAKASTSVEEMDALLSEITTD